DGAMSGRRRRGGRVQKISLLAPRNAPLRTGRCRVRRLRSSFTIATSSGKNPARRATEAGLAPRIFITHGPAQSVTNSRRFGPSGRCAPGAATSRGSGTIISGMNELSKDAVNWLTVGDDSAGQRVDNFLTKVLKGVPKSHIYRILRSGEVRVNKVRVGPDARLARR